MKLKSKSTPTLDPTTDFEKELKFENGQHFFKLKLFDKHFSLSYENEDFLRQNQISFSCHHPEASNEFGKAVPMASSETPERTTRTKKLANKCSINFWQ